MFFVGGLGFLDWWIDYVCVGVFAIFIGRDTYVAAQLPPTVSNAILSTTTLFSDIINLFIRILSILGDDN